MTRSRRFGTFSGAEGSGDNPTRAAGDCPRVRERRLHWGRLQIMEGTNMLL